MEEGKIKLTFNCSYYSKINGGIIEEALYIGKLDKNQEDYPHVLICRGKINRNKVIRYFRFKEIEFLEERLKRVCLEK